MRRGTCSHGIPTGAPAVDATCRNPARSGKTRVLTAFYGYPADLVARWCRVSLLTARLYKTGVRKPSRTAFRLFVLHRDRRVLGDGWADWSVNGLTLVDPDGNVTTQAQLRAYWLVMQLAAELANRNPDDRARFLELLRAG